MRNIRWMKLVLLLLAAALLLPMAGHAENEGDYQYKVDTLTGTAVITGYTGAGGSITLPAELGGYPVTAVGNSAFKGQSAITEVVVPAGVVSLGRNAFDSCTALQRLTLHEGIRRIGYQAFARCPALRQLTLPQSLLDIESRAFDDCTGLESLIIPNRDTRLDPDALRGCSPTLIAPPGAYAEAYARQYSLPFRPISA